MVVTATNEARENIGALRGAEGAEEEEIRGGEDKENENRGEAKGGEAGWLEKGMRSLVIGNSGDDNPTEKKNKGLVAPLTASVISAVTTIIYDV